MVNNLSLILDNKVILNITEENKFESNNNNIYVINEKEKDKILEIIDKLNNINDYSFVLIVNGIFNFQNYEDVLEINKALSISNFNFLYL